MAKFEQRWAKSFNRYLRKTKKDNVEYNNLSMKHERSFQPATKLRDKKTKGAARWAGLLLKFS